MTKLYLITDNEFHCSYLVSDWIECFEGNSLLGGIIVRDCRLSSRFREEREVFHQCYSGFRTLSDDEVRKLKRLYQNLSRTELEMIKNFGFPPHSATYHPSTVFFGKNLNDPEIRAWLQKCVSDNFPFFFIYIGQILEAWWIDLTSSRIINAHSAVLPYARGVFAVEQLAAKGDGLSLMQAAGATVHYIDERVDTGSIIRAQRLDSPFQFVSIWELKAHILKLTFELLLQVAKKVSQNPDSPPPAKPQCFYGPNFRYRDYTIDLQIKAEREYLIEKLKYGT